MSLFAPRTTKKLNPTLPYQQGMYSAQAPMSVAPKKTIYSSVVSTPETQNKPQSSIFGSVKPPMSANPVENMRSYLKPVTPKVSYPSVKPDMSSQQQGGIYDQNDNQIGSSEKRITITTPTVTPKKPTTITNPPTTTSDQYGSLRERYNANIDTSADNSMDSWLKRAQVAQEAQTDYEDYLDKMFGVQKNELNAQGEDLKTGFNDFKTESEAGIEDLRRSGERQKASNEMTTGEAIRKAAEAKRQTDAQRQNMFAQLGTIDSGGAMGFTGQQINADAEFNRGTQTLLAQKAQKDQEIDDQVAIAERKAVASIQQEARKLQTALRQISNTLQEGTIEYDKAKKDAYRQFQTTVFDIADQINGLKVNAEQQKLAFEQSLMAIEAENMSPELSDSFLQTGVPQTRADFMYRVKNGDTMAKLFPGSIDQGKSAEKQNIVSVVDELLNRGTKNITGLLRSDWVPGSGGAYTKNIYEQLRSMLSLENREKLKGTGAISDYESKILANSASALGQNLSDEDFVAELLKIKNILGGGVGSAMASENDPLALGF